MKRILIILITIYLQPFFSFGQYFPFVDNNKIWSSFQIPSLPPYSDPDFTSWIKFANDSLINDTTYLKVFESNDSILQFWELYGFIREDTLQRVYFRNLSGQEGIIYDFSVSLSDTIEIHKVSPLLCDGTYQLVVSGIDSILIGTQYHRIIEINSLDQPILIPETWIEGIGSRFGPLNNTFSFCDYTGTGFSLGCLFIGDTLFYKDPYYEHCFYPVSDISDVDFISTVCKILPNPFNNKALFIIESTQPINTNLKIYNIAGTITKIIKVKDSKAELIADDFYPGIYFYKLYVENNLVTGKFIIQ